MNYQQAQEKLLTMKTISGYHLTIRQGNLNDEDTYYPDYKPNNPMMNSDTMILKTYIRDHKDHFPLSDIKHETTPPVGRNQKSHNIIQSMNQKNFR